MNDYKLLIQNAVLDPGFKKNVQSQLNNIRGLSIKTDAVQLTGLRESIQKQVQDIKVGSISMPPLSLSSYKLSLTEVEHGASQTGEHVTQSFGSAMKNIMNVFNFNPLLAAISSVTASLSELKGMSSILTEIQKTGAFTDSQLKGLEDSSFESASRYGKKASDYLSGIQQMSSVGFDSSQSKQLSELSLTAQAAGNMGAELANKYLLTANSAYQCAGNIEKLNAILDGQNMISDHNLVTMTDMANATIETGAAASRAGVSIEELSAMIGTIQSGTFSGGQAAGESIRYLLANLSDVSSDKIVSTLDAAGVSMTKMKNGIEQLRNPMDILKDLAAVYNSLDASDPLKSRITSNIGSGRPEELSALLAGWSDYNRMVQEYSQGSGSAMTDAAAYSKRWEGSLNRLSNTWSDMVQNIANSDGITDGINGLNKLLEALNKVTSAIGPLGTIGIMGAGIMGAKGLGKQYCFIIVYDAPFYKAA